MQQQVGFLPAVFSLQSSGMTFQFAILALVDFFLVCISFVVFVLFVVPET